MYGKDLIKDAEFYLLIGVCVRLCVCVCLCVGICLCVPAFMDMEV